MAAGPNWKCCGVPRRSESSGFRLRGAVLQALTWLFFPPFRRVWTPVVVWMVFIFTLSAVPGDEYPEVDYPHADKIVHVLLYAPLGFFLARASWRGGSKGDLLLAVLLGLSYAATDEWHQFYVPNRSASLTDWVADGIGVMIGALFFYQLLNRRIAALRSKYPKS